MSLTLYLIYNGPYELKRPITIVDIKHFMKDKEGIYADNNLILVDRETGEKLKLDPNTPIPENIRKVELIQKPNKTLKETIIDGFQSDMNFVLRLVNNFSKKGKLLSIREYVKQETGYCDFWVDEYLAHLKTD